MKFRLNENMFLTDKGYVLTSDEEIKEHWRGYAYKSDVKGQVFKNFYNTNPWYKDAKIIIASSFKLEGVVLFDLESAEYGIDQLSLLKYPILIVKDDRSSHPDKKEFDANLNARIIWKEGYKADKSKQYTEEDMLKAIQFGLEYVSGLQMYHEQRGLEFVKSLNQPKKLVAIEVEEEPLYSSSGKEFGAEEYSKKYSNPKIVDNKLQIIEYFYE